MLLTGKTMRKSCSAIEPPREGAPSLTGMPPSYPAVGCDKSTRRGATRNPNRGFRHLTGSHARGGRRTLDSRVQCSVAAPGDLAVGFVERAMRQLRSRAANRPVRRAETWLRRGLCAGGALL